MEYINGIEGFCWFAKKRLIKNQGITKKKYHYFIKRNPDDINTERTIYLII